MRGADSPESPKPRYALLDALRGLSVASMVLYHAMYDVVNILGFPVPWFRDWPGHLWQQSVCWTFILLSGFCWGLSRRHTSRGLILVGCGAAVSLITGLVMPSEAIRCGVLTLLGLSALLLWLLELLSERLRLRLPDQAGLALSALLFFLLRDVPQGFLGFEGLKLWELPAGLYRFDFLAVLGFPPPDFVSSDYFPLIPWFFLYLTGRFLQKLLFRSERVKAALRADPVILRPLCLIGRHSLLIYLLHQPALMGIFWLFSLL